MPPGVGMAGEDDNRLRMRLTAAIMDPPPEQLQPCAQIKTLRVTDHTGETYDIWRGIFTMQGMPVGQGKT